MRFYNACIRRLFQDGARFDTDEFRLMLVTSAYEPDRKRHTVVTDVVGEVVADGYARGGLRIPVEIVEDDTGSVAIAFGEVQWPKATITARGCVIYRRIDGGLVSHADFGADKSSSNGEFAVTFSNPMKLVQE